METRREPVVVVSQPEMWVPWPVSWSAIWVGALAALALALLLTVHLFLLGFYEFISCCIFFR